MGFKMNGSPAKMGTISGTAGHSSALKMRAEQNAASALKAKKAKTYEEAFDKNLKYQDNEGEGTERTDNYGKVDKWGRKYEGSNVKGVKGGVTQEDYEKEKERYPGKDEGWYDEVGSHKSGKEDEAANAKGKADFKKAAQDWNMKTYGTHNPSSVSKKGGMTKKELAAKHKASKTAKTTATTAATTAATTTATVKPTKKQVVVGKGELKKANIASKATKRTNEVDENVDKRTARINKKDAKKDSGKTSKEYLKAKQTLLEAKEADRTGAKGGKKQGIFGKLSSKINARKQRKNKAKIKTAEDKADANYYQGSTDKANHAK